MWSPRPGGPSRSLTAAALDGDPVAVVVRDVRLAAVAGADGVVRAGDAARDADGQVDVVVVLPQDQLPTLLYCTTLVLYSPTYWLVFA